MRRIFRRIFNNWPLKLAAVGLATLMYGGLALSQNTQTYPGQITVSIIGQPPKTVVISGPPPVTSIRYFAPNGVPVASSTFTAQADLSSLAGKTGIFSVPIEVDDPRSRIHGPRLRSAIRAGRSRSARVEARVPVTVVHGTVPDGLTLGTTVVDPATVTISGAQTLVSQVVSVRADVIIQSTGIDVDEDVRLIPVDNLGNAIRPRRGDTAHGAGHDPGLLRPPDADDAGQSDHHRVAGRRVRDRIATVNPQVVLVAGDADTLAQLASVDTAPIPMTGVSDDETVTTDLALPTGVVQVGDETHQGHDHDPAGDRHADVHRRAAARSARAAS